MDDAVKKMRNLAKAMRKAGVSHYKSQDIELSLDPKFQMEQSAPAIQDNSPDISSAPEPDQMATLLWSSQGIQPELEDYDA